MRVGFVGRYPPTHCGVAEYTKMLAVFLRSVAPNIDIKVFSTTEAYEEYYIEKESNVRVYPCFKHKAESYSGLLDALAEVGGVDILHIQHEYGIYGHTDAVLRYACKAREEGLARGIVVTMHTVYHPLSGASDALIFQRSLGKCVDVVIVHSRLQEFELRVQGIDPHKVRRIPHGTLLNPYLGIPRDKLLNSLGIKRKINRALLALPGFLRKDKGVDILLKAVELMSKKPLILIAGEPQDKCLAEMIKACKDVLFLPKYLSSDEILRIVAAADAIAMPYRDSPGIYSVSGILHLSMGALKPIIGTRVPRLVELYENAHRLTTVPEDVRGLAKLIMWVLRHYDYAVVYASNLYSYAVRVQWARMARRHLVAYRSLLKMKRNT